MLPKVAVIIVHYGEYDELRECLTYLTAQSNDHTTIYVVDNNTPHPDATMLYENYPKVIPVLPGANLGFSGGCNAGIKQSQQDNCDYFFILNNDARISMKILDTLVETMAADSSIGIIGPLIRNPNLGETYLGQTINWERGKTRYRIVEDDEIESLSECVEVDLVEGCGMLFRRTALEAVGGFDERYFLYFEDTDICVRTRNAGFKTIVHTKSTMDHAMSQTTGEGSPLREYYLVRNGLLFFSIHGKQHGSHPRRFAASKLIIGLRYMIRGEFARGRSYIYGILDYYTGQFSKTARKLHRESIR